MTTTTQLASFAPLAERHLTLSKKCIPERWSHPQLSEAKDILVRVYWYIDIEGVTRGGQTPDYPQGEGFDITQSNPFRYHQ